MKITPIAAWYDLWVGLYWDRQKRWLYVLPLPCLGIVIKPFEGLSLRALLPWERLTSRHRKWLKENDGTVTRVENRFKVSWSDRPIQEDGQWLYRSYAIAAADLITPKRAVERAMARPPGTSF